MRRLAVSVLAIAACRSSTAPRPGHDGRPAGQIDAGAPVVDDLVELLDPGAEPRRPLRWRAEVGTRGAFTLDWTLEGTTTSTLGDGQPVTRALHARFVVDAAVRSPARIDLRIRSVDADPPHERGLKVADLERLEASHVLLEPGERRIAIAAPHRRPFVATIEQEAPRKYPAERAVLLQAVDEVLGAGVTWPAAPIGVGARWRVHRTVGPAPEIAEDLTYELVSLDGDEARVRFAVARTPSVQTYEDRVLTELEVEILALSGDGAGELAVRLDRPWPIRFERDQRLSKHTRTQVGLRGAGGGVVMADGGETRIELHTLASVAAAEPETIADVSPRTDGAYCSNDVILACERFLPDGRWMWAVEEVDYDDRAPPARSPTDLVWPKSATVWRWSGWGRTIYLLHFEGVSTIATLSADATRLELRTPGDKKVRRRRFMPATLPPVP